MFQRNFLSLLAVSVLAATSATAASLQSREIAIPVKVTNNCPDLNINVYYGQQNHLGLLSPGQSLDTTTDTRGFFYIDEHGDPNDFNGVMRIGVSGNNYYYLVRDPNWLQVGASIAPTGKTADANGFCTTAECDGDDCAADSNSQMAYIYPPTRFPNPGSTPPSLPLHECPGANDGEGYTITFCPKGNPVTGE